MSASDCDPVIISPTCQEFLGVRYYLRTRYYQRFNRCLHRVVWEHFNGPIQAKFHVHHVDGDRANNSRANLAMLSEREHISHHRRLAPTVITSQARAAAIALRRSPGGGECVRQGWERGGRVTLTCLHCEQPFSAFVLAASRSKFCHRNCQAKYLRRKWRSV